MILLGFPIEGVNKKINKFKFIGKLKKKYAITTNVIFTNSDLTTLGQIS